MGFNRDYFTSMSYIIEGLYLGNLDDVWQTQRLKDKGISHILSIDKKPLPLELQQDFIYQHVYALDMETTDLLSHLQECIFFIDIGRSNNGAVFVHCFAGHSRSATIVLAYIMQKFELSLDDALTMVMKQRPRIKPNPGFQEQLELFEAMGNTIDFQWPDYKKFRLNNLARKIQTAQIVDLTPGEGFSVDPTVADATTGPVYKCKKCRRALFKQSCLLSHVIGAGESAFKWVPHPPGQQEQIKEEVCTQSLFIEPVQWMGTAILEVEGKLSCPKCSSKLGSFNWSGERCPCGTYVTPAFHVQTSKVDKMVPRAPPPSPALQTPLGQTNTDNKLIVMSTPDGSTGADSSISNKIRSDTVVK